MVNDCLVNIYLFHRMKQRGEDDSKRSSTTGASACKSACFDEYLKRKKKLFRSWAGELKMDDSYYSSWFFCVNRVVNCYTQHPTAVAEEHKIDCFQSQLDKAENGIYPGLHQRSTSSIKFLPTGAHGFEFLDVNFGWSFDEIVA